MCTCDDLLCFHILESYDHQFLTACCITKHCFGPFLFFGFEYILVIFNIARGIFLIVYLKSVDINCDLMIYTFRPPFSLIADYLVTKCGVLMMSLFVFFTTTMSVSFTLRETQARMLKFTGMLFDFPNQGVKWCQHQFMHAPGSLFFPLVVNQSQLFALSPQILLLPDTFYSWLGSFVMSPVFSCYKYGMIGGLLFFILLQCSYNTMLSIGFQHFN